MFVIYQRRNIKLNITYDPFYYAVLIVRKEYNTKGSYVNKVTFKTIHKITLNQHQFCCFREHNVYVCTHYMLTHADSTFKSI